VIDNRLLKIELEVGNTIRTYTDLDISASGTKVTNERPNEFTISITNISKEIREKILSESNVLDRNVKNKKISVYAGRKSTGYTLIFKGDIRQAKATQPPDIKIEFQTFTSDALKYESTLRSGGEFIKLSALSQKIATSLQKRLVFEATDKQVGSYSYTGSKLKEVEKLAEAGNVNAYIDDDTLVVKNSNVPLKGFEFNIDKNNGMIGKPEINERGVTVKILFDPRVIVGSKINITSEFEPNANGSWTVFKITYDLQNRNQSFYMVLEATQIGA
jgi:hypothetical protein